MATGSKEEVKDIRPAAGPATLILTQRAVY
jgi:hypothetical protein